MAPETNKKSILERLPSELIHIICGFLPDHDLGHFRLTNKECAEIGGSHIVRGIHVMFTAKSFQNLLKISRHPVLSRHVTSIFYEARFMEEISREEWEACIRDSDESIDELGRDEKGGFDENLFEERLKISFDKGWKAYELMYEEQEYMRDAKYEFTVFAQALANFPNLKNIQATSDLDFWSEQLRRAYANTFAIRGFMLEGEDVEEKTGVRALSCVAQAISGLPTRIESLRVRRVHWSFFNPAPKGLNLRRHLFTHLRHVDLIVEAEYEDVNDLDLVWMQHEELGLALRSATALESIRLSFGATDSVPQLVLMERSMNIPVSLAPLVGNMTWKNLKTFELHVVDSSEADLTSFFLRHSGSLKHVKLGHMWLMDDAEAWDRIFLAMKQHLSLESLVFQGVWGVEPDDGRKKLMRMDTTIAGELCRNIQRGAEEPIQSQSEDLLVKIASQFMY